MMEAEGPLARVERTLWTVWCFISDAVNRLIRPQPTADVSNEQNPSQESAGEGEPPNRGDAEADIDAGEDALVTLSLLNSRQTVVDEERSITEANIQPDEDDTAPQKTPSGKSSEGKEHEEAAEKELDQTGQDDLELLVAEDANQREEEETQLSPLHFCQETSENDKHEQHVGSNTLTNVVITENIQESERETISSVCVVTTEDHQETSTVIQLKDEEADKPHPEHEQEFKATDIEGDERTITDIRPEENDDIHEEDREQHRDGEEWTEEEAGNSIIVVEVDQKMEADEETPQGNNQLVPHGDLTDVGAVEKQESVIGQRSEIDEARWSLDSGGEEGAFTEEENDDANNWATHEVSEQNIQTHREDGQEQTVSSEHAAGSDSPAEREKSLYAAEFMDKESDAADSRFSPGDQGFVEIIQTTTTVMVKLEGETRREMSEELESIPLGTSEGRVVVLEELNTPACEETQEQLPEDNNELGQDENTTQRFLEVGDYKEFQSAQLPEEVESGEQESPQNAEAACLPMSESVEEERESTGDTKTSVDLAGVEPTGILPHLDDKQLFEEAIRDFDCGLKTELSEGLMKTEVGDIRMVDGTEDDLFGFGTDEALSNSKEAVQSGHEAKGTPADEVTEFTDETLKAEAPAMTQELLHTTVYGLENVPAAGAQNDGTVNNLDTKNNMEGLCNRVPLGAEPEMQGRTETDPLAPMAGELITQSEEEDSAFAQYVLSTQVETGEIKNQFPRSSFEIEKEINGIETADDFTMTESRAEDLPDMSTEESAKHVTESGGPCSSISGHQDLIDEEILDLWLETTMSSSSPPNSQDDAVEETSVTETRSHPASEIPTTPRDENSRAPQEATEKESVKSAETETGLQKDLDDATGQQAEVTMSFFSPDGLIETTASDSSDEVAQSLSRQSRSGSEASSEEGVMSTKHCSESEKEEFDVSSVEEQQSGDTAESSPNRPDAALEPMAMLDDHTEVDAPVLDFTPQRSRISLKNPRVRPPNNPRYLLNMPSLEPTSSPVPVKPPAGVPFGGLGIGIKLPGLAAGFPLLKKTQRTVKDEDGQETPSQEAETTPEEKGDHPEKEEAPHKPKWTPPKHPGFGNPLMSELKTKLKKTSNE